MPGLISGTPNAFAFHDQSWFSIMIGLDIIYSAWMRFEIWRCFATFVTLRNHYCPIFFFCKCEIHWLRVQYKPHWSKYTLNSNIVKYYNLEYISIYYLIHWWIESSKESITFIWNRNLLWHYMSSHQFIASVLNKSIDNFLHFFLYYYKKSCLPQT